MRVRPVVTAPRIVQPGGHARTWLLTVVLVLVIALAWQAFDYGRKRAGFDLPQHLATESQLRQRVQQLEQERDQLRMQEARFQRAAQIDQAAMAAVQTDLKNLQQQRAELRRQVALLKSLVSGDATSPKLVGVKLQKLGDGGHYRFAFSLTNRTLNGKRITGQAAIQVVGQSQGKPVTLTASDLGVDNKQLRLGFKNYQKITGDMTLPSGFVPSELQIDVASSAKQFKAFKQVFHWDRVLK